MKNALSIEIKIPIIPLYKPEKQWAKYFRNGIKEILSLDGKIEFDFPVIGKLKPKISLTKDFHPKIEKHHLPLDALVFHVVIPNRYKEFFAESEDNLRLTSEEQEQLFKMNFIAELRSKIYYFLVLTNIAKPGIIKTSTGEIWVNKKIESYFHPIISIHRESLDDVLEMKWPKYSNLKFTDVWNWFNKYNFSFERHSQNPTERALNAFTHLFKENSLGITFDLFWSLIGIEALFCKGKEGLSNQIFNKTQVLLGEISDYKKKLTKMYEFRSRLIHGDLEIPPNHYEFEDENEEEYQENLYQAAFLAVAILTATFQKMVELDKNEIDFKYRLKE